MTKIPYAQFKGMLMNPDISDADIAQYLKAIPEESGPFDPRIEPDPDKVDMTNEAEFDVESAMRWGNAISRARRHRRFTRRLTNGVRKPVLVSEGDSWFQFPFLIDDVIDHLEKDYLIWSLDAAGDTAENMVNRGSEYKAGLDAQKVNKVAGFLFSAAGNDIIGEDESGTPVLTKLLKSYTPGRDAHWHVDKGALAAVLTRLEVDYGKVVTTIRADQDFRTLPIFIHGYDYAIPGGYPGDTRRPSYAKQDEWLGGPLKAKNITDVVMQRDIIRFLIDGLYDMLERVAGKSNHVILIDVRGTLKKDRWADEIHGTSDGFGDVAALFNAAISREIG